jgi:hypothetical protein
MSCWCSLLGKYSARSRPLTVKEPSPGIRRARAIACLRRPTAAPDADDRALGDDLGLGRGLGGVVLNVFSHELVL